MLPSGWKKVSKAQLVISDTQIKSSTQYDSGAKSSGRVSSTIPPSYLVSIYQTISIFLFD